MLNRNEIPYTVAGGMSNVIVRNKEYNGVVVKTTKLTSKNVAENAVDVSCGAKLSKIIYEMAAHNYGGMEGLFGIPGTVGGMVKQNAGAYGYEISDRFTEAVCYLKNECKLSTFTKADMRFSYRKSALSQLNAILISAKFDFIPKPQDVILSQIREFRNKRMQSQPLEYPSLGSVFKRHNGVGAGFYIDRCGLKGYSIGGACVSDKHAGFIVNTGAATADDYLRVIEHVKKTVYAAFGIELEEEIEII